MPLPSSESQWTEFTERTLANLQSRNLLRSLRCLLPSLSAVQVSVSGDTYRDWCNELGIRAPPVAQFVDLKLFSSNDYLGVSTHPQVILAAAEAVAASGMGPRSSAVVGGYTMYHRNLEIALARLKGTEDALLFPSGFAANQATIASLASSPGCAIFSDELNHASIIDGARLARASGARLEIYRHNDIQQLESLLDKCPTRIRKLVVTDSLFSMDGDFAELQEICALKARHDFLLMIDEAHATFVCGKTGAGAAEAAGISQDVDIHVGTLSKAAGCQGGFVACSSALKSIILNMGRPYVFSTALPLPTVAAATAALKVSANEPWRREHLWNLVHRFGTQMGVKVESPIIPLILGQEQRALAASGQLLQAGFHVPAIRPPTVKANSCRLRISLSAAHTTGDVDALVNALRTCEIPAVSQKAKL